MKLVHEGLEDIALDDTVELWMVLNRNRSRANLIYSAPATSPQQAYANAGAVMGDPAYTTTDLQRLGYYAEKVFICTRKLSKPKRKR